MDVQRELAVGGDVVQPARTWGLHSICILVKGLDAESNPTQYSEVGAVWLALWSPSVTIPRSFRLVRVIFSVICFCTCFRSFA